MEFKLTFASGSRGSLVGSALKSKGLLITVLFPFFFRGASLQSGV